MSVSSSNSIPPVFPHGLLQRELQIGVVSSLSAQVAKFNLSEAGSPSAAHLRGGRYGRGEVGEFVLIEGQTSLLLGRIVEVRLPERDRRSVNPSQARFAELDAVGAIQLLGTIAMDSLQVTAGVACYPRLGDRVYLPVANSAWGVCGLPGTCRLSGLRRRRWRRSHRVTSTDAAVTQEFPSGAPN